MVRMIDQIEARLTLLRITAPVKLADAGVGLDAAPAVLQAARTAVTDGILGYGLLIAGKPSTMQALSSAASSLSGPSCRSQILVGRLKAANT